MIIKLKSMQRRNQLLLLVAGTFVAFLIAFMVINPQTAHAASVWDTIKSWFSGSDSSSDVDPKKALDFLQGNAMYLKFTSMFSYIGNVIVWGIIKLLYWLDSAMGGLVNGVFDIGNLLNTNADIKSLYNTFVASVAWIIMAICAVWFAIRYATSGRNSGLSLSNTAQQLIISVILLVMGPTMINTLYSTAKQGFDDVTGGSDSLSVSAISKNTDDILYLAQSGKYSAVFPGSNDADKTAKYGDNAWNAKGSGAASIDSTDFTSVLTKDELNKLADSDAVKSNQKDALKYMTFMVTQDEKGKAAATEIPSDSGGIPFIKIFSPGYARYPANKLVIIIEQLSIAVAYLITAFTIAMTLVTLPFKMMAGSMAVATLREQKIKMVVSDVFESFMLIFWTGVELRFYQYLMTAISGIKSGNAFVIAIGFVAATFMLWKGQDSLTKYFGINTGLRGGIAPLAAGAAGAMMLAKGGAALTGGSSSVSSVRGNDNSNGAGSGTGGSGDDNPDAGGDGADAGGPGGSSSKPTRHPKMQAFGQSAKNAIQGAATGASYLVNTSGVDLAQDAGQGVKKGAVAAGTAVKNKAADVGHAVAAPVVGAASAVAAGATAGKALAETRHPSTNAADASDSSTTTTNTAAKPTTQTPDEANDAGATPIGPATTKTMTKTGDDVKVDEQPDKLSENSKPTTQTPLDSKAGGDGAIGAGNDKNVSAPGSRLNVDKAAPDVTTNGTNGTVDAKDNGSAPTVNGGGNVKTAQADGDTTVVQDAPDTVIHTGGSSAVEGPGASSNPVVTNTPTNETVHTQGKQIKVDSGPDQVTRNAGGFASHVGGDE